MAPRSIQSGHRIYNSRLAAEKSGGEEDQIMRIPNAMLAVIAWTILTFGCETTPDTGAEYGDQSQDTAILAPQERT